MKTFTLYGLRKPGEEARYIGITSGVLSYRLAGHLKEQTEDRRGRWIAKAKRENSKIEVVPFCVGLSKEDACELERAVIAELRKIGLDLVNTHEGGGLPPDATGKKHALGYKHTPEWKAAASVRNTGNKHALGHKHTPEWKAAASVRNTGNKNALGCKGNLGHNRSQKTKEKVSAGLKLFHEKKRQESYLAEMWGSRG